MIPQADSTLVSIVKKVRRLTASASEASLALTDIYQYINTYYNQDFPYSIKIDQQRSVYTFFTEPYRDRYPLDVNYWQGMRAPAYVDGYPAIFFKDRQQFFNIWPRYPTFNQIAAGNSGTITGIAQPTNPCQITTNTESLLTGDIITISGVLGMTELNGNAYQITVVSPTLLTLDGVDNTAFGSYAGGGSWASNTAFFNIPGPLLSTEVTIGGIDSNGDAFSIGDDGNGHLLLQVPNPQVTIPIYPQINSSGNQIPGMYNKNTGNPGLNNTSTISSPPFSIGIGTVNYITGDFNILFPVAPMPGTLLQVHTNQYQTGLPYSILFWNNELTIRPIPKYCHKITLEGFQTPVQFLSTTDTPILNQWWQLIAIGAAIKVLEDRQDMDGVQNLITLYDRQEDLVLERQGVEEIFQPNITLFNTTTQSLGYGYGWGSGGF